MAGKSPTKVNVTTEIVENIGTDSAPINVINSKLTDKSEDKKSKQAISGLGKIYRVRFWGEYYVNGTVKGQTKRYEFDNILMTEHERSMGFLHVFVRQILKDEDFLSNVARVKYPDWKKHRTFNEDGVEEQLPDGTFVPITEFGLMNRQQLVGFIELKKLDIDHGLYPTAAELKQAITDYRDSRQAFLALQDKRRITHGASLKAGRNIKTLNNWSNASAREERDAKALTKELCIPKDLQEQDEINEFLDAI